MIALVCVGALALGGCRDDDVEVYESPNQQYRAAQVAGGTSSMSEPPPVVPMQWTLPEGWQVAPEPGRMRYATLLAPLDGETVEVVITNFGGDVGGLLANIDRWRGQIGLPPAEHAEAMKDLQPIGHQQARAFLVDMTGPEADGRPAQRSLIAMFLRPHSSWFIKLTAEAPVVEKLAGDFRKLVESVWFGATTTQPASRPRAIVGYDTPAGWRPIGGQQLPRVLAFETDAGGQKLQAVVTRFSGDIGEPLDNVNRWRRQVGLEPVPALNQQEAMPFDAGDAKGVLFDFQGPEKRQLVAMMAFVGGLRVWFVKLDGPPDAVGTQVRPFTDFVRSLKFEQEDSDD